MNGKTDALEREVISLRQALERMDARQSRMDDAIVKLIEAWNPLILLLGEAAIVLMAQGKDVRASLKKRVRDSLAKAREMLPSTNGPGS